MPISSIKSLPPFFPLLPNRVWRTYLGGKMLDKMEGECRSEDSHFPEDWIVSTTRAVNKGREGYSNEGLSKTKIGDTEYFISDLFKEYPQQMLGSNHQYVLGCNAGFLLKYLDSSVRLHIQCHPTIRFSKQYLNSNAGKTEGYIILGNRADIDPYVYMGFQRSPDIKQFKSAIQKQDTEFILSHFDKIPVTAGDVFLVPGGLPHAIGEGVFMIEIMEPTDFAVRIEFERSGYTLPEEARFMGRDIDFALNMFDFSEYSLDLLKQKYFVEPKLIDQQDGGRRWSLFDERYTSCFRAERFEVTSTMKIRQVGFRSLIITAGIGTINVNEYTYSLCAGTRLLIPNSTQEINLVAQESLQGIIAMPPLF